MNDEHAHDTLQNDALQKDSDVPEKRICLPEPDVDNITVLTKSLPNEPILPWHHFDSPWLGREESDEEEAGTPPEPSVEPDDEENSVEAVPEQLTLDLQEVGATTDARVANQQLLITSELVQD